MNPVDKMVKGGQFLTERISLEEMFTPEDLTDEHKMIQETARKFLKGEVYPHRETIESGDYDLVASLMKQAGELGLLGHSIPEAYGGLGLDKISKGIVGEALGSASGYSVAHSNHTCIASLPITYFGTKEQKETYLPKLASGEFIGAYCLTEPEAGSDALSARTTAVLNEEGTHYILNGTKIYITNAAFADTFIVYAKVDGEHFSAFIVERGFSGVSIGPEEQKMGIKGSSTCSVIFEDCQVPVKNLLGDVGRGHVIALNVLNLGRFNLGFATTGASRAVLDATLAQVTERKQFKRRIADFPATQEKLATMASELYAAESVMYRTAGLVESALGGYAESFDYKSIAKAMNEHALESAICKVVGSETLDYIADEGVQLHGGAGFIKEYPVEQAYRDARINRIFEGTNEINRLLIPGAFFKRVAKGEVDARSLIEKAQAKLESGVQKEEDILTSLNQAVETFRNIFLVCAGAAYEAYGEAMKNEQETLMKLANIAIDLYRAESSVIRAEKARAKQDRHSTLKEKLAQTFVEDCLARVETNAKYLGASLLKDEIRSQFLMGVSINLNAFLTDNRIERNRVIASQMIEANMFIR
ncbi:MULTISPECIES: acyl-CoA dehydrogenase family protein [Pontibacillus]|uniref:Acyl-CoA dehydrogenase family protein n=1 Tax=Pontibacillus chungwhensis TaxID=265426 RepID=A0ABY8UV17_9BACI|nr:MULTISPECIES: acyl-CoA dehydrogenase family protein [Pontibacillus]MCD5323214.1 acyl-CoA dehydrogenase family protein [Pontibacillus sp. HN14]WIF96601.1 acyl-CoA dehydrogenase family protein [Pontibacillus chungwhensis]